MRGSVFIFAVINATLLSGCCTPWHGPATTKTPDGVTLCAKHRIPLLTVRGYTFPSEPKTLVNPTDAYMRAADCYPNLWPLGFALEVDGFHTEPTSVTYCPKCDRHF